MKVTPSGVVPTPLSLRVGLVIRGPGGWVKFATVDVPWAVLRDRMIMQRLNYLSYDQGELEDQADDTPLF